MSRDVVRPRGQKQIELAEEPGRRRQARQAEQANCQQQRHHRLRATQAAECPPSVVERFVAAARRR